MIKAIVLGGGMAKMRFFSKGREKVSTGKGGSVLTGQELRDLSIIQEGDEAGYQLTSYDLRLGSCHYVYDNSQKQDDDLDRARWRLFHIGSDENLQDLNRDEKGSQKYEIPSSARHTLTIPPYGSAIIELKETVDTYTAAVEHQVLVVGRFDLKLSKVYQALISQQATQVEPFYQGKLYCFIHNLSGNAIRMDENDKIATIEFSYAGKYLDQDQWKKLIEDNEKNEVRKYAQSQYANKHGINEVRWFYEQKRLPSDCGLNGLYAKAERNVSDAVKKFDQTFEDYFAREDTQKNIAERVQARIQEKQRSLEILVTVVTGILSLGFGSIIWMFYQELAKVIARQDMYNVYLSGKDEALEFSGTKTVFEQCPWLIPYIAVITLIVTVVFLLYIYKTRETKGISEKAKKAVERELDWQLGALRFKIAEIEKENRQLWEQQNTLNMELRRLKNEQQSADMSQSQEPVKHTE